MDLYADQILDHYKHPRHSGSLTNATIIHEEANLSCGDRVKIELHIKDDVVTELGWTGAGCAISQAGMSLLSEVIAGKKADELLGLKRVDVVALLGVPISERRLKCALLSLHTLQNALRSHQKLPTQSWVETVAEAPNA